MTWVKIADTFADDPRLESAGPEALVLHVAGLCYCSRQLTDGRVPARAARRLWSLENVDAALEALVREGLWERLEDGSYRIVEYLNDQPSAEQVLEQRAQKAKRQAAWRAKRVGGRASTDASRSPSTDVSQDTPVDAAPPRPAPKEAGRGAWRLSTGRATSAHDIQGQLQQLEQSGDDGRTAVAEARRVLPLNATAAAVAAEARRQLRYQREEQAL